MASLFVHSPFPPAYSPPKVSLEYPYSLPHSLNQPSPATSPCGTLAPCLLRPSCRSYCLSTLKKKS